MSKDMNELQKKMAFVKDLSEALTKHEVSSVAGVSYEVFKHNENDWYQEYLKVTYDGGGYAVRSCNGDGLGAIFKETAKLLYGGYYDEVQYYDDMVKRTDWHKVD